VKLQSFLQLIDGIRCTLSHPGLYLGYCVTPSSYGLYSMHPSLRERVEKGCWTSLALCYY
jgi:hypothetical protein